MSVKTKIVVDVNSLHLSGEVYDYLSDFFEVRNDSYHRYYPDESWDYIKPEVKSILNEELLRAGVVFPEVLYREPGHPQGYFLFYVLLHFSW